MNCFSCTFVRKVKVTNYFLVLIHGYKIQLYLLTNIPFPNSHCSLGLVCGMHKAYPLVFEDYQQKVFRVDLLRLNDSAFRLGYGL